MSVLKWIPCIVISLNVGAVELSEVRSDMMIYGTQIKLTDSDFLKDITRMKLKGNQELDSYVSRSLSKTLTKEFYKDITGYRDGLFWTKESHESIHPWVDIDPLFTQDYDSELFNIYPIKHELTGLNKSANKLFHFSYLNIYKFNNQSSGQSFSVNSIPYKNAKVASRYITSATHFMNYLPLNDIRSNVKIGGKKINNSPAKHRIASNQKYFPIYDRNYNYINNYKVNSPLKNGIYVDGKWWSKGADQALVSAEYGFDYRRDMVKISLDQMVPERVASNGNHYVSSSRISKSPSYFNSVTYDNGVLYFIKPVRSSLYRENMCRDILPDTAYKPSYQYKEALDTNYDPIDDLKSPIASFIVSSEQDKQRLLDIQKALGKNYFSKDNILVVNAPLSEKEKVAIKNQKEWMPPASSVRFVNSGRFKATIDNEIANFLIPDALKGVVTLGLNDIRLWGFEHPVDVFYQEIRAQRSEADCAIQQTSLRAYSDLTGKRFGKLKGGLLMDQYSFSTFTPENGNALYDLDLSRDARSKFKGSKFGKGHAGHEQNNQKAAMKFFATPIEIK